MEVKQKKLPKSQIELEFELTAEEFDEHFKHALEHLKSHVKVEGFRPGHAPAKLVEDRIGKENLLMEAGDHAVQHVYSDYIRQSGLEPAGHPEVKIKKIAKGNPFIFTATITVLPEVELPDYKKIAASAKSKEFSVTEQEAEDAIKYLQKSRAKMSLKNDPAEKGDFVEIVYQNKDINSGKEIDDKFILGEARFIKGFEENILGMKAGEEKTFELPEKGSFKVVLKSVQNMELPEINDEFAKQLGTFESLVVLKTSIKEGITAEKEEAEKQRRREEILEKIAAKSKFEVPESLVEHEKQRLLDNFKDRISQTFSAQGGPASGWEEYLSAVKQTEEQLKESFKKQAEKQLTDFLILREIGRKEKIEVSDAEIEAVDTKAPKEYTKNVLFNEKVFKLLECQ